MAKARTERMDPVLLARKVAGADPALLSEGTSIAYHGVMIALSKARAMGQVLEELGTPDGENDLLHALEDRHFPDSTRDWLHTVVAEALQGALDDAEGAYRQLIAARWPEGAA